MCVCGGGGGEEQIIQKQGKLDQVLVFFASNLYMHACMYARMSGALNSRPCTLPLGHVRDTDLNVIWLWILKHRVPVVDAFNSTKVDSKGALQNRGIGGGQMEEASAQRQRRGNDNAARVLKRSTTHKPSQKRERERTIWLTFGSRQRSAQITAVAYSKIASRMTKSSCLFVCLWCARVRKYFSDPSTKKLTYIVHKAAQA